MSGRDVRVALGLAAALSASAAVSDPALVSERTPVRPGLWFDARHDGSGFDVHATPDGGLFVVWYTYRADGSAAWYTAQGAIDRDGRLQAALYEHRASGGAYAGLRVAGQLELVRRRADALDVRWALDGATGAWSLQPSPVSGAASATDHTGAWVAGGGYGLTLHEQADERVAFYYAYDGEGRPAWLAGSNGGNGRSLRLTRYTGACPSCAERAVVAGATVDADVTFDAIDRLRLTIAGDDDALPAAWRFADRTFAQLSVPAPDRRADGVLAAFDDAATLERHIESALADPAARVAAKGVVPALPPATPGFSGSTGGETGVGVPDAIATDGLHVYALDPARRVVRIARVADGPIVDAVAEAPLQAAGALLVHADRLVAIDSTSPPVFVDSPSRGLHYNVWRNGATNVEILARGAPLAPRSLWRARIDGHLVAARRVDGDLYVVTRGAGPLFEPTPAELDATPLAGLVPRIRVGDGEAVPLVAPERLLLPASTASVSGAQFMTVTRIALRDPADRDSFGLVAGVEGVAVTARYLYVATTNVARGRDALLDRLRPEADRTDVHRFALGRDPLADAVTGAVPGVLGDRLSRAPARLVERAGRLHVLTTGDFGAEGAARLTVLDASTRRGGLLLETGRLPNAGRPEPLVAHGDRLDLAQAVGNRLYLRSSPPPFSPASTPHAPLRVVDLAGSDGLRAIALPDGVGRPFHLQGLPSDLLLGLHAAGDRAVDLVLYDGSVPDTLRPVDTLRIGEPASGGPGLAVLFDGVVTRVALPLTVYGAPTPSPIGQPYRPVDHEGLYAFDVTGRGATARLTAQAPLVARRAPAQRAFAGAPRAVLYRSGVVYVDGDGTFWSGLWNQLSFARGPG